jgi:hypothetical protein
MEPSQLAQYRKLWVRTTHTRAQCETDLLNLYLLAGPDLQQLILPHDYLAQIISAIGELYAKEFPSKLPDTDQDRHLKKLQDPEATYQVFLSTFLLSLVEFTRAFPFRVPLENQTVPLFETQLPVWTEDQLDFTPALRCAFEALCKPLQDVKSLFQQCGIFNWEQTQPFGWQPFTETVPRFDDRYFSEREPIYGNQYERREWRERKQKFEQEQRRDKKFFDENILDFWKERKKEREQAYRQTHATALPFQTLFYGSPYHLIASKLPPENILIPFDIPQERWFEGTWITAPQGSGKTNLLRHLALNLMQDATVIMLDPKGDLINSFKRLATIKDRLVILEPDLEHPLALNPLDIGGKAVEVLEYLFSVFNTELTPLQGTLFSQILTLMATIPDATLDTLLEILSTGIAPYQQYVAQLKPRDRSFFEKEFNQRLYNERKPELTYRIRMLLRNPYLEAMLTSTKTKLNMTELLDSGSVVCINNNYDLLTHDGAEFLGRLFLAMIWYAGRRRRSERPVYVIVDEAHFVIAKDRNIERMITQLRSKKVALIFAHQQYSQIKDPDVQTSLRDCAIKFTNSTGEAMALAPFFDVSPDFLKAQGLGSFACSVKFKPPTVSLSIPYYPTRKNDDTFSSLPLISPHEYQALLRTMRARYAAGNYAFTHLPDTYDVEWMHTLAPSKAEAGCTVTIFGIKITIPPRTKNGKRFRLRGKGAVKPDGTVGDAYLTVSVPQRPEQRRLPDLKDDA